VSALATTSGRLARIRYKLSEGNINPILNV
jgi:hypothetical protein